MYDVIGDIHGHADALVRLLATMGYAERGGTWRHPDRQVVFLGDFVDRGPEIRRALEIAKRMVDDGAAQAVMGNHEFNAVAFHMEHPAANRSYLRERSYKNIRQYMETVRQLKEPLIEEYTRWFLELPLWLDLGGLRVIHACWDPPSMAIAEAGMARHGGLNAAFMHEACEKNNELFDAVEVLLKGKELTLPDGIFFYDKDGNKRHEVRTKWFLSPQGRSWRKYAFGVPAGKGTEALDRQIPNQHVSKSIPYPEHAPPVLFGHYWMPGEEDPEVLSSNTACLDYSVAKGGKLCAYRWDGESKLVNEHFVSVPAVG